MLWNTDLDYKLLSGEILSLFNTCFGSCGCTESKRLFLRLAHNKCVNVLCKATLKNIGAKVCQSPVVYSWSRPDTFLYHISAASGREKLLAAGTETFLEELLELCVKNGVDDGIEGAVDIAQPGYGAHQTLRNTAS